MWSPKKEINVQFIRASRDLIQNRQNIAKFSYKFKQMHTRQMKNPEVRGNIEQIELING